MRKQQKTLVFNEELCQLIQAYADRTGTSFSRVCTAAALQFFFGWDKGPDTPWMEQAVLLENGAIPLHRVPVKWREIRAERCQSEATLCQSIDAHPNTRLIENAKYYHAKAVQWDRLLSNAGDDIDGLIDLVCNVAPRIFPDRWLIDEAPCVSVTSPDPAE